jgi:hypothetical protein
MLQVNQILTQMPILSMLPNLLISLPPLQQAAFKHNPSSQPMETNPPNDKQQVDEHDPNEHFYKSVAAMAPPASNKQCEESCLWTPNDDKQSQPIVDLDPPSDDHHNQELLPTDSQTTLGNYSNSPTEDDYDAKIHDLEHSQPWPCQPSHQLPDDIIQQINNHK